MKRNCLIMVSAVALTTLAGALRAEPKSTSVVKELTNPSGIAVQPDTGVVFVADSGAGRIVKIVDGKAVDAVTDFPKDEYGKGPKYAIGPLGLAFLDKNTLVVGGGGLPDGEELLRVYALPEDGKPVKADAMASSFKLEPKDEIKGEGNFYALAVTEKGIFVTCNGDDTKGWVSKATVKDGKVEKFERSIATKEATEVDAPVAITGTPQKHIAVGQMGEITVPDDGLLTYYDLDGKMLANYKTGLSDITALAYSGGDAPLLYALDFSWHDVTKGGLFRIDGTEKDGKPAVETVKLLSLDKPTAMAFGKDGELYVTIIGKGEGGATGELLKIESLEDE